MVRFRDNTTLWFGSKHLFPSPWLLQLSGKLDVDPNANTREEGLGRNKSKLYFNKLRSTKNRRGRKKELEFKQSAKKKQK